MALFPRRIDGKYVMLSRKDRENLHLSTSDDVHFWNDVAELLSPAASMGAAADRQLRFADRDARPAGSCSRTASGRCGATRSARCCSTSTIRARVIGHLREPLHRTRGNEREGYVPNVVYTCGAMVHGGELVLPYGFSDSGVGIAIMPLDGLTEELRRSSTA